MTNGGKERRQYAPEGGGFTFETAGVETLWYDFSAIPGVTAAKGRVVIPEPSSKRIGAFLKELQAIGSQVTGTQAGTGQEVVDQLSQIDPDALENFSERITSAVATVCQGSPSVEELGAIPWRYQLAFFGYVSGGFLDPKPQTTATRP